ncbi:MAG: sulfurtransferase [Phormidesmis sp. RL_2_1]|nr:sulfurtransferase [Phormidesmis sp. RL_2_1]
MTKSPYLVDVQWLSQQLETTNANLVVIDTRFSLSEPELGRKQYESGHIPGAYYVDLNQDLASDVKSHGGRHPLPDWAQFTIKLNQMGLCSPSTDEHSGVLPTQVVIYDDSRFAFAARLWWMLRYLGHEQVAILDGGIQAWRSAGLPITTEIPEATNGNFRAIMQADWIVDINTVRQQKDLPGVVVIDSRAPERFRGEVEPIDPIAGSIPGAINSFWQEVTTEAGQLKGVAVLSKHWASLDPNDEIIVYCGSGVTACVNLFSLVLAGHPMHKLYPGGWSDWCSYLNF